MPIALFGLILSLALWDVFKFCSEKWQLDRYPLTRQCLVRGGQCGELSVILCFCCIFVVCLGNSIYYSSFFFFWIRNYVQWVFNFKESFALYMWSSLRFNNFIIWVPSWYYFMEFFFFYHLEIGFSFPPRGRIPYVLI